MDSEKQHIDGENAGILGVSRFTRRTFLKRAGVAALGATITAIAFTASCKTPLDTSSATTNSDSTAPQNPPGSTGATSPASSTFPASTPPSSTSLTLGTTSTVAPYSYTPPTALPPMLTVTGTSCVVATDRVYSADHIWVKAISNGFAAMGITTTLVDMLAEPNKLSLFAVGTVLAGNDIFGSIEGFKLSSDLPSPVSGTLVQINDFLINLANQGSAGISPIIDDPYNSGWLVVVRLSKPAELDSLLTAAAYRDMLAKK